MEPEMESTSVERVLAANLDKLMGNGRARKPQAFLAAKGVAQSAVRQILRAERSVTIGTLATIAREFDLEPWQLLVPSFDVTQPPLLQVPPKGNEESFYRRILEKLLAEAA